jgi:outer membrane protein OmpA-like peptidoglycan-associated protein
MITLLLTFFVLLVSMGKIRDETLLDQGQGVRFFFLQSVKTGFGIREEADFGKMKTKYYMENPELREGRTPDEKEERRQRLFETLNQSMKTRYSQLVGDKTTDMVTGIRFAGRQANLDEASKGYLEQLCRDVRESVDAESSIVYVVGLAGDETNEERRWILSAKRAEVVADFMQTRLSTKGQSEGGSEDQTRRGGRRIYCWGAGGGEDWVRQDLSLAQRSHILIAVLKRKG